MKAADSVKFFVVWQLSRQFIVRLFDFSEKKKIQTLKKKQGPTGTQNPDHKVQRQAHFLQAK